METTVKTNHAVGLLLTPLATTVCAADVVRYSGPYVWYRQTCFAVFPPTPPYFDVTQPATSQPAALNPGRTLTYSFCAAVTSCSSYGLPMYGCGIQRSLTPTPVSWCGGTFNIFRPYVAQAGETIGPVAASGASWDMSADHGVAQGTGAAQLLQLPAYIGVRVQLDDGLHYGWIRLESFGPISNVYAYVISDWAYETMPDTPIIVNAPATTCTCEFDQSPGVTSQDFFDFLTCFLQNGCEAADINDDATVNTQDLFDFLSCFFTPPGVCG